MMKIFVSVKASAKETSIKKIDDAHFSVSVKAPPVDGKANIAVRYALADYFHISISAITLLKGNASKQKIFDIR